MYFRLFLPIFAAIVFSGCSDESSPIAPGEEEALDFEFTFSTSDEGFKGDFSDYPDEMEEDMNLVFQYTSLPEGFAPDRKGLKIAGSNSSDDLFMYIKKKLGSANGIKPNKVYQMSMTVEFATAAASGCAGIGGSPGESVYLKAGSAKVEPKSQPVDNYYEMNIDKGNQAEGGKDAVLLGHVGNNSGDCTGNTWEYKTLTLGSFSVQTDIWARIWLIIGTDSGFEGRTTLYYTNIKVKLTET